MSAKDELRRLLDERGVEWDYGITGAASTMFNANGVELTFIGMRDGVTCSTILTPAQAIEATLGPRSDSCNCTNGERMNLAVMLGDADATPTRQDGVKTCHVMTIGEPCKRSDFCGSGRMTFYNHIENVRTMAINLTHGEPWHGARDKARVFDSLDAARSEYMQLQEENAKLRDLMYDHAHDYAIQHMTEYELRITATNTMDENRRLRELLDFALPIAMYAASTEEGDRIREMMREVDV